MAHPLGTRWDPGEEEVRNPEPYDYAEAKRAIARGSREQADAARARATMGEEAAEAEKLYRVALAKRILSLRAEGVEGSDKGGSRAIAWTVCADVARGDEHVAALRFDRDVKAALYQAAEGVSWQASANRRALEQLVEWSMKVAPLGQGER